MNEVTDSSSPAEFHHMYSKFGRRPLSDKVKYALLVSGKFTGKEGSFRKYMKSFEEVEITLDATSDELLKILRVCLSPE